MLTIVHVHRRRVSARLALAFGIWCAAAAILLGVAASPTPSLAAVQCTSDLQGAMDEPGQKDLTRFCFDSVASAPFDFVVSRNSDNATLAGSNTGAARALFDTDMDGTANFALFSAVEGDPSALDSVRRFSCGDDRPDRCGGARRAAGWQ